MDVQTEHFIYFVNKKFGQEEKFKLEQIIF